MLTRLKNELLETDASACLPRSLTDEWLENLAASADRLLRLDTELQADKALIVGVLVRILEAKSQTSQAIMQVSFDEMEEYVKRYRLELALEEVHRKTDITYNPATLETILTEREITTWKKGGENS